MFAVLGDSFHVACQHYDLFPKAVGQIIESHDVKELHLSLTQGLWRHDKWGYPVRSSPPGAELWAWFNETPARSIDESWANLVNSLSGLFCASLNFIDATNTVVPNLSFRPSGVVRGDERPDQDSVRYASLPKENVCTENLTPWQKLLPCNSKAGLSTLLNAIRLYNAHYHTLTVDVQPVCQSYPACTSTVLRLTQSISVVFRPTLNAGHQQWSLQSLFDRPLKGPCPLAVKSYIHVDISNESISLDYTLNPPPSKVTSDDHGKVASYDVAEMTQGGKANPPTLHAHRFIAGYGQENGGITCMIYNNDISNAVDVVYMETLPWYVRLYLHTMKIKTENGTDVKPDMLRFVPGRDRGRPYLLELMFTLPPASVITFSIQFDRAFLKWTEYPPDANIGFYLGISIQKHMFIVKVCSHQCQFTIFCQFYNSTAAPRCILAIKFKQFPRVEQFIRIYTEPLLLQLPLPDFSMPYNVICLVCTVFAIAFGSIHNLTTRRLDYEKKKETIWMKVKRRIPFLGKKEKKDSKESKEEKKEDGRARDASSTNEDATGDAGRTKEDVAKGTKVD
ncbi:putative GPI transamidase component PIG-T-like [Apostichopus japonicus]|uniref:Putative GPI transamidase component PIG-T-like n=1 Tax=Stichopus japonicus TaxID=307972 RepID=A0A2G8L1W1_STIJA|nr:putative GPI transamidase component PIG-T-like [Apostichopus japonicus]